MGSISARGGQAARNQAPLSNHCLSHFSCPSAFASSSSRPARARVLFQVEARICTQRERNVNPLRPSPPAPHFLSHLAIKEQTRQWRKKRFSLGGLFDLPAVLKEYKPGLVQFCYPKHEKGASLIHEGTHSPKRVQTTHIHCLALQQ